MNKSNQLSYSDYVVMGNHLHLLLRVDVDRAESWSAKAVARRWLKLHPVRNGYFQPIETTEDQIGELVEKEQWLHATREKLCSISQFMKELKQRIAQPANRADHVTGAFWEGRYKVKAVHDEAQLLTTMAYIDLNPFAADVCKTPEEGHYTSLQGRLGRDKPLPVAQVRPAYEGKGKKGKTGMSGIVRFARIRIKGSNSKRPIVKNAIRRQTFVNRQEPGYFHSTMDGVRGNVQKSWLLATNVRVNAEWCYRV